MLSIAANGGHKEVVDMYLAKNPALAFFIGKDKQTILHHACRGGHQDILSHVIRSINESALSNTFSPLKKQLDHQNSLGQTALMLACRAGSQPCAKILIEQGADVWLRDQQGRSSLHYAAVPGGNACCALLLLQVAIEEQQHQQGLLPGTSRTVRE
jgi:ankyrin repeat protein